MSLSQESSTHDTKAISSQRRRRRRTAPPPARLSWPGALVSQNQPSAPLSGSQPMPSTNAIKSSPKKRPRNASSTTGNESSGLLWTDHYAPKCRNELCVAPKKVTEVATWMEQEYLQLKLLILVGKPGIGKSAMVRVLAEELNMDLLEWNDSYSSQDWTSEMESLSPLKSFAKFLQQCGVGFSSLDLSSKASNSISKSGSPRRRLILLEELPNLANMEMQAQFRELFTNHIQNTHVPTVWIYSDGSEGHSKPQELERHVEAPILYQNSKILQINPATKSQLKKALERIAKAEKFKLNKEVCEQWHGQSGGDVRWAINSLQFHEAGRNHPKALLVKKPKTSLSTLENSTRDTHWTAFHALGKILYAKRTPVEDLDCGLQEGERPPLTYDPEQVLEHCDFELGHSLSYLGYHTADFYTDIEELSEAMDLYSDAAFLLGQSTNYNYQRKTRYAQTTVTCPIFPEGYVTSLAGRAVAHTNRHPAPSRFRQLNAPKVLEIGYKAKDNAEELRHLQRRLSLLAISHTANDIDPLTGFVTDRLPYLRKIVPEAVNASLDQLHTSNSEDKGGGHNFNNWQQQQEAEVAVRLQEEQRELLQMDDIDEYSSNDENEEEAKKHSTIRRENFVGSNSALASEAESSNNAENWTGPRTLSNAIASTNPPAPSAPAKLATVLNNPYKNSKLKKRNPPASSVYRRPQPSQHGPVVPSGQASSQGQWIRPSRFCPSDNSDAKAVVSSVDISVVGNGHRKKSSEPLKETEPDKNNPEPVGDIILMDV